MFTPMFVSDMTPIPEMNICQVLDRLGPSIFAGVLDTSGLLRFANRSALQAIGGKADQVLGQSFIDTPWWQACEVSRQQLRDALATGMRGEASRFDVRVSSVNGAILSMDFSLTPLCNAEGQVSWLIPSARDMSEIVNAEHKLRFMRSALRHARDALLQVEPDGRVAGTNASATRLLGFEQEYLLQQRMSDFSSYSDPKSWSRRWDELCELGELRFETSLRHYLGFDIQVDVFARMVATDRGSYALLSIVDLREREAAKFRLRQCKDELRQLVEVLHEQIAQREQAEKALSAHLQICGLSPSKSNV